MKFIYPVSLSVKGASLKLSLWNTPGACGGWSMADGHEEITCSYSSVWMRVGVASSKFLQMLTLFKLNFA